MSISFTRKTDYALVALAGLSPAGGEQEPQSARQLAVQYGLPVPLLMNLMKRLHEVGLLRSRRGIGGGYWLAKPTDQITVADVIAAIEGPMRLTVCCDENEPARACMACKVQPHCPVSTAVHKLNNLIVALLRSVTIEDLRTGHVSLDTLREAATDAEVGEKKSFVTLATTRGAR
jgi:Rrf2 family protein